MKRKTVPRHLHQYQEALPGKDKKLATEKYGLTEVEIDPNLYLMQGDEGEIRMHTARKTNCKFIIGVDQESKECYYAVQNADYENMSIPQDPSLFPCHGDTDDQFPFGLLWFNDPNKRWDNLDTLKDMANGRFIEEIDKILAKLRDSGIIEKYL